MNVRVNTSRTPARRGSTLTEVLISMLIMGIGIVSLATLFPISVLRSIQATQLTNAAILRYNVEARIDLDATILWPRKADGSGGFTAIRDRRYVVDPLGAVQLGGDFVGQLQRADLGALNLPLANQDNFAGNVVTMPDSFTLYDKALPTNVTATSVTMPADIDLTEVPIGLSRVTIFDALRKKSVVRDITLSSQISGQDISWDVRFPLPAHILNTPGEAHIHIAERRYTWLLNIRRSGKRANVDVVVFFGRKGTPEEEQTYGGDFIKADPTWSGNWYDDPIRLGADGEPGDAGVDDDLNGIVDRDGGGNVDQGEFHWPGSDDNRTLWNVQWAAQKPIIKKGGFVFDVLGARWYRIEQIVEQTPPNPNAVNVVLERDIVSSTPPARVGAINNTAFMRAVIDVFPIGTKTLP